MSWDFYKSSTPKARREYDCDWKDHLELSDIINPARPSISEPVTVNYGQCREYGFTEDEIKTIEQYIADDFKIKKGEVHSFVSGKTGGGFWNSGVK